MVFVRQARRQRVLLPRTRAAGRCWMSHSAAAERYTFQTVTATTAAWPGGGSFLKPAIARDSMVSGSLGTSSGARGASARDRRGGVSPDSGHVRHFGGDVLEDRGLQRVDDVAAVPGGADQAGGLEHAQ